MANEIQVIRCRSAGQFLNRLRRSSPRWLPPGERTCKWIFRGQSDNLKFKLVPNAWRPKVVDHKYYKSLHKALDAVSENYINKVNKDHWSSDMSEEEDLEQAQYRIEGDKRKRIHDLMKQNYFEMAVLNRFVEIVDDLGLVVPGGGILRPSNVGDPRLGLWESGNFHPAVALAQHHGLPTRLLDWTFNPIIAAAFAVQKHREDDSDHIAVWAVHRDAFLRGPYREYHVDRSQIGYLKAQEGLFTYRRGANKFYYDNGAWPILEAELQTQFLRKVICPKILAPELENMLFAERLSYAHLMPSYDNVTKTLNGIWEQDFERINAEINAEASDAKDQ